MTVLEQFARKAKNNPRSIVYPEGDNPVILKAAARLFSEGLAKPVLLGEPEKINRLAQETGLDLNGLQIVNPQTSDRLEDYITSYCAARNMPPRIGQRLMNQPLYFGAMMVKQGHADCMVAGINHPTEEVIMVSELIIGLQPDISVVSSFFLMQIPAYSGGENGLLVFADPAVNPDPD
ncbi:MAG: phosphate acetyltransferase, partial [Anaerolineae bacterium]|nr:phosphate acetyltransferase [Anaerolineae bacterium]